MSTDWQCVCCAGRAEPDVSDGDLRCPDCGGSVIMLQTMLWEEFCERYRDCPRYASTTIVDAPAGYVPLDDAGFYDGKLIEGSLL